MAHTIGHLDGYIAEVETRNTPLDWTNYYHRHNPRHLLMWIRYAMWGVLIVLSLAFVGVVFVHGPFPKATCSTDAEKATVGCR